MARALQLTNNYCPESSAIVQFNPVAVLLFVGSWRVGVMICCIPQLREGAWAFIHRT